MWIYFLFSFFITFRFHACSCLLCTQSHCGGWGYLTSTLKIYCLTVIVWERRCQNWEAVSTSKCLKEFAVICDSVGTPALLIGLISCFSFFHYLIWNVNKSSIARAPERMCNFLFIKNALWKPKWFFYETGWGSECLDSTHFDGLTCGM